MNPCFLKGTILPNKLKHIFYREFGLRKINQLLNPRLVNLTDLPRQSIYHYYSNDEEQCNIDPNESFLNYKGVDKIMVQYVTELKDTEGNPRRIALQVEPLVRKFHRQYRKFKRLNNAVELNSNPRILTLVNYSYINKIYRYPETRYADIAKWNNINKTIFKYIDEDCNKSQFDNYVTIEIPRDIPSRSLLNRAAPEFTVAMSRVLSTDGDRHLLELWKWLDPKYRAESIYSNISTEHLSKVNIIFKSFTGKSAIINLAYLYSWIEGNDNLTPIKSITTKKYDIAQKALLFFCIILNTSLDLESDTEVVIQDSDVQNTIGVDNSELDETIDTDDDEPNPSTSSNPYIAGALTAPSENVEAVNLENDDDISFEDEHDTLKFEDMDKVLDDLEKLNKIRLKKKGLSVTDDGQVTEEEKKTVDAVEVEAEIFTRSPNTDELLKKLDKELEYGSLSAADLRKFNKGIEAYQHMEDPYGSGVPLVKAKEIKETDLIIDDKKATMKVSDLVPDESMKKSSLNSFDHDYNKKVIRKDILNVVDSLQRGGILVRDYQVVEENSILGSYEVHSVELKPIDGAASTIHFRVPKINDDGTYSVSSNKYVMRTQRVD